ncbi:MAG: DUF2314 domain-containing protein [Methylocystis sp.]|nr:DUF2314 domain-containing protein [Methylocystis sp.]
MRVSTFSVVPFLIVLATFGEALTGPARAVEEGAVEVAGDDAAMKAAMAKARASLPTFWKSFEKPGPGEAAFNLKVALMAPSKKLEHIWVNSIRRLADGKFAGRIDNTPQELPGVKAGDEVTFSEANISDWMFTRNGKIVGNETIRPMLADMPKDEADAYRAMLEKP